MSIRELEILNICRDYFLFDEFGNRNIELPEDVEIIRDGDPYDEEYIIQSGTSVARVVVRENFGNIHDEINKSIDVNTGTFNNLNEIYETIHLRT